MFDLDVEVETALGAIELPAFRVRAYVISFNLGSSSAHVLLTLVMLVLSSTTATWGLRIRVRFVIVI